MSQTNLVMHKYLCWAVINHSDWLKLVTSLARSNQIVLFQHCVVTLWKNLFMTLGVALSIHCQDFLRTKECGTEVGVYTQQ